jgi:hypothetical protein
MARPAMTEDQRVVAVALLANAIRKERRLRARAEEARQGSALLAAFGTVGRSDGAAQYVRGMHDLLAVLFDGGRATADACYEEARVAAEGRSGPTDD